MSFSKLNICSPSKTWLVLGGETLVGDHGDETFARSPGLHMSQVGFWSTPLHRNSKSFMFLGCCLAPRSFSSAHRSSIGLRFGDWSSHVLLLCCLGNMFCYQWCCTETDSDWLSIYILSRGEVGKEETDSVGRCGFFLYWGGGFFFGWFGLSLLSWNYHKNERNFVVRE